jgi:hypothetical protein
MDQASEQPVQAATESQPSEDEMRAAYEAELNRITSSELILQTTVSLINIGGRRLGLASPGAAGEPSAAGGRDLEQVRDAIDGAGALLPILERHMPGELGPIRDAVAQLQVAYAREAQSSARAAPNNVASASQPEQAPTSQPEQAQASQAEQTQAQRQPEQAPVPATPAKPTEDDQQQGPGPAQASGRLWVPGR